MAKQKGKWTVGIAILVVLLEALEEKSGDLLLVEINDRLMRHGIPVAGTSPVLRELKSKNEIIEVVAPGVKRYRLSEAGKRKAMAAKGASNGTR